MITDWRIHHGGGKFSSGGLKFFEIDKKLIVFVKPEAQEEEEEAEYSIEGDHCRKKYRQEK